MEPSMNIRQLASLTFALSLCACASTETETPENSNLAQTAKASTLKQLKADTAKCFPKDDPDAVLDETQLDICLSAATDRALGAAVAAPFHAASKALCTESTRLAGPELDDENNPTGRPDAERIVSCQASNEQQLVFLLEAHLDGGDPAKLADNDSIAIELAPPLRDCKLDAPDAKTGSCIENVYISLETDAALIRAIRDRAAAVTKSCDAVAVNKLACTKDGLVQMAFFLRGPL
jgi:hypothetical protein